MSWGSNYARLRTVAFCSVALNLFLLGYLSATVSPLNERDHHFGHPPFMDHGHRPPPPFLFHDAVSPTHLEAHFDAMRKTRQALIDSLRADQPPTAAQLNSMLDQMQGQMKAIQDEAQTATVKRILGMNKQERAELAHGLEEEDHFGPR